MNATMERPIIVPFRWPAGRRLDIRACIWGEQLLFVASDICRALVPPIDERREAIFGPDRTILDAPITTIDGLLEHDGTQTEFYTVDTVRALAADRPLYLDDDGFLDWFERTVDQVDGDHLSRFAAGAVHPEPGLKADDTHSVARAARLLTNEGIPFGQQSLFAALERLGWIYRQQEHWAAHPERLAMGHLARLATVVGPMKDRYLQVRITPAGLTLLRSLLTPTAHPILTEQP